MYTISYTSDVCVQEEEGCSRVMVSYVQHQSHSDCLYFVATWSKSRISVTWNQKSQVTRSRRTSVRFEANSYLILEWEYWSPHWRNRIFSLVAFFDRMNVGSKGQVNQHFTEKL